VSNGYSEVIQTANKQFAFQQLEDYSVTEILTNYKVVTAYLTPITDKTCHVSVFRHLQGHKKGHRNEKSSHLLAETV
jgi:hypothetical protein